MVAVLVPPEGEAVNGRLPAHADSNLDLLGRADHDFTHPLLCPCLPAIVECETEFQVLHDAVAARVLRSEDGHP